MELVRKIKSSCSEDRRFRGCYGRVFFLLLGLVFFGATISSAHRVIIFAWVEDGKVFTESKFPGGQEVRSGQIEVLDEAGRPVLTGVTDEEGAFSFNLDALEEPSALKIVLKAGPGHQADWELSKKEVAAAMGKDPARPAPAAGAADSPQRNESTGLSSSRPVESSPSRNGVDRSGCMKEEAVEAMVEAALDRKMSPLMKRLRSIEESLAVGLDDVMAGIGYIFGLAGVGALVYARRSRHD